MRVLFLVLSLVLVMGSVAFGGEYVCQGRYPDYCKSVKSDILGIAGGDYIRVQCFGSNGKVEESFFVLPLEVEGEIFGIESIRGINWGKWSREYAEIFSCSKIETLP